MSASPSEKKIVEPGPEQLSLSLIATMQSRLGELESGMRAKPRSCDYEEIFHCGLGEILVIMSVLLDKRAQTLNGITHTLSASIVSQ